MTFTLQLELIALGVGLVGAAGNWLQLFQPSRFRAAIGLLFSIVAATGLVGLLYTTAQKQTAVVPPTTDSSATVVPTHTIATSTYAPPPEPQPAKLPPAQPKPSVIPAEVPAETTSSGSVTSKTVPDTSTDVATKWQRAFTLSKSSRWTEAAAAWRDFVRDYAGRDAETDHKAFYNLGVAYEALRDWDEAAKAFVAARKADVSRSDTSNLLRLGRCYAKLGRWSESTAMYEEVLKIDPENETAKRCVFWTIRQQPPTD